MKEYIVDEGNERIDTYLSKTLNVSRSKVSKMLEKHCLANDHYYDGNNEKVIQRLFSALVTEKKMKCKNFFEKNKVFF